MQHQREIRWLAFVSVVVGRVDTADSSQVIDRALCAGVACGVFGPT